MSKVLFFVFTYLTYVSLFSSCAGNRAMASGVKRKHEEVDRDTSGSYTDQRQSILNISMVKLRSPPVSSSRRGDTSLRRSVLIFNTLRHIESELNQEGVTLSSSNKPLLPSLQPITDVEIDLRPCSDTEMTPMTPQPVSPLYGSQDTASECHDDQERTLQRLETMEISPATSAPFANTTTQGSIPLGSTACLLSGATSSGSALPSATCPLPPADTLLSDTKYLLDSLLSCDKLTVASFASLFEVDSNANSTLLPSLPTCQTTSPSNLPGNHITTTTSSMPGADFTEALADLDLDFDLFMPLSSKLTPLSAEELMHTLPSGGDPFPGVTGVTQNPSPCTHKNELLSDELDHVMQVLRVGGI